MPRVHLSTGEKSPSHSSTAVSTDNVWSAAGLQGKSFGAIDKSAAMYSAFEWRTSLLAMMSSAACLSLQVGRSLKTIIGIRLKARRCDCSFVFAVPVQTSVGKFKSVDVVPLRGLLVHATEMLGNGL